MFGHDQRAIEQSKIADLTGAVRSDRKRAARVTRYMVADDDCTRRGGFDESKDLGALAVKAFAKFYGPGDRMLVPIALYPSVRPNVAHSGVFGPKRRHNRIQVVNFGSLLQKIFS
jgi:hypothetical protein